MTDLTRLREGAATMSRTVTKMRARLWSLVPPWSPAEGAEMPRLMSVSLTEDAVRDHRKTVTRRLGWRFLKPGDRLTLCRKVMGRKRGEPLVRIAEVEVVSVRREQLWHIDYADVQREGFAGWMPLRFCQFFADHMKCGLQDEVTRIEWRYLDGSSRGTDQP